MSFGPRLPCRLKRFALRTKVIVPSHGFTQSHVVTCVIYLFYSCMMYSLHWYLKGGDMCILISRLNVYRCKCVTTHTGVHYVAGQSILLK